MNTDLSFITNEPNQSLKDRDELSQTDDMNLAGNAREAMREDRVVLNVAPLWELVPWREAKKYREALLEGKYEWSSIGKQLRGKGLGSDMQMRLKSASIRGYRPFKP